MKAFVTGGAGFIGSHIVDRLLQEGNEVTVYDNFCTGKKLFIKHNINNPRFKLIEADVLNTITLNNAMKGHDFVFHLQANADVRGGITKTKVDLEQNTIATWNVLDAMRINNIKKIAFSSSATVYGEPKQFPTPENYPLIQTSLYGASKLAGEAMIEAYCEYYDIQCFIFRFVSWIGERYTHGVIFDFIKKLQHNPTELEVLGDGNQKKSYMYVGDGVEGIFFAIKNFKEQKNIFNLGHTEFINVLKVADIICEEMNLKHITYKCTGGVRGWKGDSPLVHLDITKLQSLGWQPKTSIEEGIRKTVRYLLEHPETLNRKYGE
ncbi:MAG: NAD-dependent epimerase/dehydratase family protein [Candidatus Woesearchaeota archaeon]|jgi:UDP-glucose 4-epimerase